MTDSIDSFTPKSRPYLFAKAIDPDYSPAYQDEYQRLWHEAAKERDELRKALERAPAMILSVEEYERWYIEDCYPTLNGTHSGTSMPVNSENQKNVGSKPEAGENDTGWLREAFPRD